MQSKPKQRILFIALYLIPLSGVGTDLYSPSLPSLVKDLSASISLIKFTLAIYLIGFSLGQIINGTLSDIYGRKPILIISLTIFTLVSFFATVGSNIYFLLIARFLQGLTAAGPSVIAKAMLTDTMTGKKLKKASVYLSTIWGLSPIIAPAIGGYLQHYYGWHANFYFFAAYAFSMLILVFFFLQETNHNLAEPNWKRMFNSYMQIAAHPIFLANVLCMAIGFSVIMIFNIFTPFLVQDTLGDSAIIYGHVAMLIGTAYVIGSISNRWFMAYFSTQKVNRASVTLITIITVLMMISAYLTKMSLVSLITPVFFLVLAVGLLQTNFMGHTLSLFPNMGGTASAAMGSILSFIAGIITVCGSLVHHASSQIPVSWIYTIMMLLYAAIYWLVLDVEHLE